MNNSIIDDIKNQFKSGNVLTRLILVNLFVFLGVNLVALIFWLIGNPSLSGVLVKWLAVPANFLELLYKPWTLLTYMFLHEGFWHIAMNMLILYYAGRIFLTFLSEKQLFGVYILGGLLGGFLFQLAYNIFPIFSNSMEHAICMGASASVIAVLVAGATIAPNYQVNLILLGPVRLKYIALFYVIMDLVSIRMSNPGGHIAHIGGAILGFWYIKRLQSGKDMATIVTKIVDTFKYYTNRKTTSKMKVTYKKTTSDSSYNFNKRKEEQIIDSILDKISKSGYESLTKEEKEILFKASNKK